MIDPNEPAVRLAPRLDLSSPATPVSVHVPGAVVHLQADRAVFWGATRTLLVADAHIGKAASFRAHGIPVPEETTTETLARLDRMLAATGATRLVLLGDFLHAREACAPDTLTALRDWRARHSTLEVVLVRGNHDRRADLPFHALAIAVRESPFLDGPLALCHEPRQLAGRYVLAGHLHPCVTLRGRAGDRARVPCFWFGSDCAVLPAFGAFTGMHPIRRAAGDRVFAVAGHQVIEVPSLTRKGMRS